MSASTSATVPEQGGALYLTLAPIRENFSGVWPDLGPQLTILTERILSIELAGMADFFREGEIFEIEIHTDIPLHRREALALHVSSKLLSAIFGDEGAKAITASDLVSWHRPRRNRRSGGREKTALGRIVGRLFSSLPRLRRRRRKADRRSRKDRPRVAPTIAVPSSARPKPQPVRQHSHISHNSTPPSSYAESPSLQRRNKPDGLPGGGRAQPVPVSLDSSDSAVITKATQARSKREARALEQRIEEANYQRDRELASQQRAVFPPPDLEFVFRPAFSRRSDLLSTYFCGAACVRDGRQRVNDEVLPKNPTPEDIFTLDSMVFEAAMPKADFARNRAANPFIVVPVHLGTIRDSDHWLEFRERFDGFSARSRERLLFEIIGLADHAHESQMFEILRKISPFCRGHLGRVPISDTNIRSWKQLGLTAVGVDCSEFDADEADLIEKLQIFAASASRGKLNCYVRGVNSISLAVAAVGAGFDYIESSIIRHDPERDGFGVRKFELSDLYQGITRG